MLADSHRLDVLRDVGHARILRALDGVMPVDVLRQFLAPATQKGVEFVSLQEVAERVGLIRRQALVRDPFS
jgi:hypothetical protein